MVFETKSGPLVVLQDLNSEICDREFVSIIGPSGGGKSTLLHIIAGLKSPTSGKVLLDGREITGPGKRLGVVFQEDAIFPWRTVIENVEYGPEISEVSKKEREEIARKYLKLVNLERFENFYPKDLSGGMKKRVALATVYANDPEILLMDEPFGSLDYPTKVELQQQLLDIWEKETKTLVFVTHDIEEALFLSDRILVLRNGNFKLEHKVDFPRPRENSIRTESEFQAVKRMLWESYL